MGSTTIEFRGPGYEASDGTLQVWLHFLVTEIDKRPHIDSWLKEVREEWELQSTAGFDFGVMPGLDRFVTDEDQRETILSLSERALHALQQKGEVISDNSPALKGGASRVSQPMQCYPIATFYGTTVSVLRRSD